MEVQGQREKGLVEAWESRGSGVGLTAAQWELCIPVEKNVSAASLQPTRKQTHPFPPPVASLLFLAKRSRTEDKKTLRLA